MHSKNYASGKIKTTNNLRQRKYILKFSNSSGFILLKFHMSLMYSTPRVINIFVLVHVHHFSKRFLNLNFSDTVYLWMCQVLKFAETSKDTFG